MVPLVPLVSLVLPPPQVDVDDCDDVAAEYNITAMPTFVFIKKGEKVIPLLPQAPPRPRWRSCRAPTRRS